MGIGCSRNKDINDIQIVLNELKYKFDLLNLDVDSMRKEIDSWYYTEDEEVVEVEVTEYGQKEVLGTTS